MAYLLDTNVLVRLSNTADSAHKVAVKAVSALHHQGEALHVTPQVLVEFRNVATRPKNVNGLGLTVSAAEKKSDGMESQFPLLPETPDIFPAWKSLVQSASVIGKQVHDARLVAVCHVHGISHVLTFNVKHFASLAKFGPGVAIVDPKSI